MVVSIDDNVQVGLELSTSALRLSGRALIAIMDMFLDQDNRNNHYRDLKPETKQGKQAVKELFAKYENTEVQALDGNLSKEEIKSIKKELKSMGVDFSIKKIEKDNYSLFFAGKDIEAIEKGMSNAINKHLNKRNKMEKIKNKVKPQFNIKNMQNEHIEKKKKERTQTKEKVKNKKPKRSL